MDDATFISLVIDYGWTRAELELAAEAWEHLQRSPACAKTLAFYEEVKPVLAPSDSVGPDGGAAAFQQRLMDRLADLIQHSKPGGTNSGNEPVP